MPTATSMHLKFFEDRYYIHTKLLFILFFFFFIPAPTSRECRLTGLHNRVFPGIFFPSSSAGTPTGRWKLVKIRLIRILAKKKRKKIVQILRNIKLLNTINVGRKFWSKRRKSGSKKEKIGSNFNNL